MNYYEKLRLMIVEELKVDPKYISEYFDEWIKENNNHYNREEVLKSFFHNFLMDIFSSKINNYKCFLGDDSSVTIDDFNVTPVQRLLNYNQMIYAVQKPYKCQIEIIGTSDCSYSMSFDGKLYDLEEAIDNFPIDYSKCQREMGCVCAVGIEGLRDDNDDLIMK